MSKGSKRRPCFVSREEEELRWRMATGKLTEEDKQSTLYKSIQCITENPKAFKEEMDRKIEELEIRQGCYNEAELCILIGKHRWPEFCKWFAGQTGILIDGEFLYYKCDVERFIEGLPVID